MTTNGHIGSELVDPAWYGEHGPPHHAWTELRRNSPVHLIESENYPPFWALTKHDHIVEASTDPETFLNEPGITLLPASRERSTSGIAKMRTIIQMDPPEHRDYRKVVSSYFTPNAIKRLEATTIESARSIIDRLAGASGEGECDLAVDVAAAHPLRVLSAVLGIPRSQEPVILRLTNELFASEDEELRRQSTSYESAMAELGAELYSLFDDIIKARRANPTGDLASMIANGTINGEPMGAMETFGYCLIAFTAGHDTTKNALAGGLNTFIDYPGALAHLRDHPESVGAAVDEVVRWVTPVNYMMRTAARDTDLGGKNISAGDRLVMFYASANRDEDIFDDPFEFRIDRHPNRHLGFGIGEHFCLGAHLARMSQRALLNEFAARLQSIERTVEPQWIKSSFVVGYKHVPVRYRFAKP